MENQAPEIEFNDEFKQLELDARLGFFRGVFFSFLLMAMCGGILYGALKIQDTVRPLVDVFFEETNE